MLPIAGKGEAEADPWSAAASPRLRQPREDSDDIPETRGGYGIGDGCGFACGRWNIGGRRPGAAARLEVVSLAQRPGRFRRYVEVQEGSALCDRLLQRVDLEPVGGRLPPRPGVRRREEQGPDQAGDH